MKKLFIIFAILCFAVPAMADEWTLNWPETPASLDHIVIHHKVISGMPTAEEFVAESGFTDVTLGATTGQTFTIPYAEGVVYGLWGEAFNAAGDSTILMDAAMSPRVWRLAAKDPIQPAHWEDTTVTTDGEIHITVDVVIGR